MPASANQASDDKEDRVLGMLASLAANMEQFGRRMDAGFARLEGEMKVGFAAVNERLDSLETRLERVEKKVGLAPAEGEGR